MAKTQDNPERDAQLRRRMLSIARLNFELYQNGFVPFGLLAGAKDDLGHGVDNEEHALQLVESLCEWGLLEESRSAVSGGASPTARHRRFKFTTKGFQLWTREIPAMPGVADDRVI